MDLSDDGGCFDRFAKAGATEQLGFIHMLRGARYPFSIRLLSKHNDKQKMVGLFTKTA